MRQDDAMQDVAQGEDERTKHRDAPMIAAKAGPIGAKLDSAMARQLRLRRAVDAARNCWISLARRVGYATTEMELADAAVEQAKKKVGPATALIANMGTLLPIQKPHLGTLSNEATGTFARI